jgi:predicted DNA-binding protein (UPF0251 family)
VTASPACIYYKPAGVPLRFLSEVTLALDELEAIRLADVEGLYHVDAAARMDVSRQTFDRIVARARSKIATALMSGQAIRIETDAPWSAGRGRAPWPEGDTQ